MEDTFKIVPFPKDFIVPTDPPKVPRPVCADGTEEEWTEYWNLRDAYYHGFRLKKN